MRSWILTLISLLRQSTDLQLKYIILFKHFLTLQLDVLCIESPESLEYFFWKSQRKYIPVSAKAIFLERTGFEGSRYKNEIKKNVQFIGKLTYGI